MSAVSSYPLERSPIALKEASAETTPQPDLAPEAVEMHINPQTVQLGQPFSLHVTLKHPKHFRFEMPTLPGNLSFDVLSKTRSRKDDAQESTTTFSFQMAAFELGTLELPQFQFEITTPTQMGSFTLPKNTISVVTAHAQTPSQLEDVRPPAPVFIPSYTVLYWGAAVVAIALAFLLLRMWLRQRKKAPPIVPERPLADRTKEALNALRAQALPAQGKTREYYFMLSEIIRGYVGELHQFDALESTTTEFLASLQQLHSTQLPIKALAQFSYESDFIKYAKGNADIAKCDIDWEFAYQLVDNTSPTDEPSTVDACHAQPPFP
ncbi:MAG: DUF4381 family protein [Cystobacterineae bacterium]|nr:DUF4381 family protein [Cystobacterineae bacterium]